MNLTISEAKAFVRACLDELSVDSPDMLFQNSDDSNMDLLIETLLPEAIIEVHKNAPAYLLEGPVLGKEDLRQWTKLSDGKIIDIQLGASPENDWEMLRVISFKCSDSDIKLTEACYEDSPQARKQNNRFLQGRSDSPVLVLMDDSPDYKPHLRYYTCKANPAIGAQFQNGLRIFKPLSGAGSFLLNIFNTEECPEIALRYFPYPRLQQGAPSQNVLEASFVGGGETINIDKSATRIYIRLLSSSDWSISASASWCAFSPISGIGSASYQEISVDIPENTSGTTDRSCSISIRSGSRSKVLTIGQSHSVASLAATWNDDTTAAKTVSASAGILNI